MTERVKDPRQLRVWKAAMDLTDGVLDLTAIFPPSQRFVLAPQLQRAAISVPSNISEGFMRESTKEFLRFLAIARGSLAEVQTQLEIARRRSYAPEDEINAVIEQATSVMKQLNALRTALREREARQRGQRGEAEGVDDGV
jgi:four helix bundle protein